MTSGRGSVRTEQIDSGYGALLPFIDVLTAAVYGYGAYEVANAFAPLLKDPPARPVWSHLLLLGFVGYYLTADSIEARLCNELFKYQNRRRFIADVIIAVFFFLAFMAASAGSTIVLVALAGVFLFSTVWSAFLEFEIRDSIYWAWPRLTIISHGAVTVMFAFAYYALARKADYHLDAAQAAWLWVFYAIWAVGVSVIQLWLDVPSAEADLLPVGLVANVITGFGSRCVQYGKTALQFMKGPGRPRVQEATSEKVASREIDGAGQL